VAVVVLDCLPDLALVSAYDLQEIFRIKALGERSRLDEITEHHGELSSLPVANQSIGRLAGWILRQAWLANAALAAEAGSDRNLSSTRCTDTRKRHAALLADGRS
jgi:hypothetical protein